MGKDLELPRKIHQTPEIICLNGEESFPRGSEGLEPYIQLEVAFPLVGIFQNNRHATPVKSLGADHRSSWALGTIPQPVLGLLREIRNSKSEIRIHGSVFKFRISSFGFRISDFHLVAGKNLLEQAQAGLNQRGQSSGGPAMSDVSGELWVKIVSIHRIEPCLQKGLALSALMSFRVGVGVQESSARGGADSLDHGVNPITVALGVFEPFEHDGRRPFDNRLPS